MVVILQCNLFKGSPSPKKTRVVRPLRGTRRGGRFFMATVHIHADESGDLRFDQAGSRHFTFAAVWTYDPRPLADRLRSLRFGMLRDGENLERFHAKNDRYWCRRCVIDEMVAETGWSFAAVVVNKSRLYSALQDPLRFYPKFMAMVLAFVLKGCLGLHRPVAGEQEKEGSRESDPSSVRRLLECFHDIPSFSSPFSQQRMASGRGLLLLGGPQTARERGRYVLRQSISAVG